MPEDYDNDKNKYIVVGVLAVGAASAIAYLWWKKQQDDVAAQKDVLDKSDKSGTGEVTVTYENGGMVVKVNDTTAKTTCPSVPCKSGYECKDNVCITIAPVTPAPTAGCTNPIYAFTNPVECAAKVAGVVASVPVSLITTAYKAGQMVGQIITDVNNKAVLDHNNALNTTYNNLLDGKWSGGMPVCKDQVTAWYQLHMPVSMSTSMPNDSEIRNMIVKCPSGMAMLLTAHRSNLNAEYNRLTSSIMPGGAICTDQVNNWLLERWNDYNRKTTATAAEISTMRIACIPIVGPAAAVVPGVVTWFTGLFG